MEGVNYEKYPKVHDTLEEQKKTLPSLRQKNFEETGKEEYNRDGPTALRADFENLLAVERELRKKKRLTPGAINHFVDDLESTGKVDGVFNSVMVRIKRETNALHEYEEANTLSDIISGFARRKIAGVRVEWKSNDPPMGGEFYQDRWRILIKSGRPPRAEFLRDLAAMGLMPIPITTLQHEVVHSSQFYKPFTLKSVLYSYFSRFSIGKIDSKTELKEMHAYRSEGPLMHHVSKIDLIRALKEAKDDEGQPEYPDVGIDKLIYAVTAVDQLNALGFSMSQIGNLIRRCGRWSEKSAIYPKMQRIIEARAKKLGLDEPDLENLVQVDKIEWSIERFRVMAIVQEELQKAKDAP